MAKTPMKRSGPGPAGACGARPGGTEIMAFGANRVPIEAVYHVARVHPKSEGPWRDEADKIAWTDPGSGYGCIIRRSPDGGHLCGYVSVPPGHPLFGRRIGGLAHLLIGVHGGIDYASGCQSHEAEEVSICHVAGRDVRTSRVARGVRQDVHADAPARAGDDAWWFGFSCNHRGDVVPDARPGASPIHPTMTGLLQSTYKDEAFVLGQCIRLATQLRAIAGGRDPRACDPGPVSRTVGGRNGG